MVDILEQLATGKNKSVLGNPIQTLSNMPFSGTGQQAQAPYSTRTQTGVTGPAVVTPNVGTAGDISMSAILSALSGNQGGGNDVNQILGQGTPVSSTYPGIQIPQLDFGGYFDQLNALQGQLGNLFDFGALTENVSWGDGGGSIPQPQAPAAPKDSGLRFMDTRTGGTVRAVPGSEGTKSDRIGRKYDTVMFDIPDPYNIGSTVRVQGTWDGSGYTLKTNGLPGASEMPRRIHVTDRPEPNTLPNNAPNIRGGSIPQMGGGGQVQGTGQSAPIRWKPNSEKDGRLVVLAGQGGNYEIVDRNGNVVERGQSYGPSNGYGNTVRFNRPGGAYQGMYLRIGNQTYQIPNAGSNYNSLQSVAQSSGGGSGTRYPNAPSLSRPSGGGSSSNQSLANMYANQRTSVGRVAGYQEWAASSPSRRKAGMAGYKRYLKNMGV